LCIRIRQRPKSSRLTARQAQDMGCTLLTVSDFSSIVVDAGFYVASQSVISKNR